MSGRGALVRGIAPGPETEFRGNERSFDFAQDDNGLTRGQQRAYSETQFHVRNAHPVSKLLS